MSILGLNELLAQEAGVRGQRVFVRADLNVPMTEGRIADDTRILASLPTLRRLLEAGARVVLASHLGRPKGQPRSELSLRPVADVLAAELGVPVRFAPDCVGEETQRAAAELRDGEILLLENLRFHSEETTNDPKFAEALASLAGIYVNDAFGTAHRTHASTAGMVRFMPRAAAGHLMQFELEHLNVVLRPERPLLCILGGAKVSDKLAVLEALAPHADVLVVGGAMAYTFLAAQGQPTGNSLIEPERFDAARSVVAAVEAAGGRLLLPTDHVIAEALEPHAPTQVVSRIPDGWMGVDIGPETAATYAAEARNARTLFWNGPMGVFEIDAFAAGTETVARAVAESEATSVVGGGDSLAAVNKLQLGSRIGHLSTGGGASLEYIQGLELPGVAALER